MTDRILENNRHLLRYTCPVEAPDQIRACLEELAESESMDSFFVVSAVRDRCNNYIEKGFIYTTDRNFERLELFCQENDSEEFFSIEDEDGFPITFEISPSNVYIFGDEYHQNKLFCSKLPLGVTKEMLFEKFKCFATSPGYPQISLKKNGFRQTAIVTFDSNTDDAYYASIVNRRLDFDGHQQVGIFLPCTRNQNHKKEGWQSARNKRTKRK